VTRGAATTLGLVGVARIFTPNITDRAVAGASFAGEATWARLFFGRLGRRAAAPHVVAHVAWAVAVAVHSRLDP
jgi:hypothetical protein